MVKYAVASSVALVQLAMLAWTSVALPIQYAGGLESRAISSPNGQEITERDYMELEAREPFDPKKPVITVLRLTHALNTFNKKQPEDPAQAHVIIPQAPPQAQQASSQAVVSEKHTSQPIPGRRDLSNLHERDWDDYEKRDFNDFEECD